MIVNILVSVIVPVYNVKDSLIRCVESITNQTHAKLEIFLVDDGSTDGSGQLCDMLSGKDPRIKVIHKKNGGLSDARNVAIDQIRGKYVTFVDSDDWISASLIELLLREAYVNDSDVAFCDFEKGDKIDYTFPKTSIASSQTYKAKDFLAHWHSEYKDIETQAWGKLYKYFLFNCNEGIRYPKGKYHEDIGTTHKLMNLANKVTFVDEKLYYYYQRKDSIMHTKSDKKIEDLLLMVEEREKWFKNHKYVDASYRLSIKTMKYYMVSYLKAQDVDFSEQIYCKFKRKYYELEDAIFSYKDKILFKLFICCHAIIKNIYQYVTLNKFL